MSRSAGRDPLAESDRRRRGARSVEPGRTPSGNGRAHRPDPDPDPEAEPEQEAEPEREPEPEPETEPEPEPEPDDEPEPEPDDEAEPGSDDEPEPEPDEVSEPAPPRKLTTRVVARLAAEQVSEMTGKESESVTSVSRGEEGWTVGLEVVESRRIPDSTDLLASYEVEMDGDGDLVSYRRVRRYTRGRGDDDR